MIKVEPNRIEAQNPGIARKRLTLQRHQPTSSPKRRVPVRAQSITGSFPSAQSLGTENTLTDLQTFNAASNEMEQVTSVPTTGFGVPRLGTPVRGITISSAKGTLGDLQANNVPTVGILFSCTALVSQFGAKTGNQLTALTIADNVFGSRKLLVSVAGGGFFSEYLADGFEVSNPERGLLSGGDSAIAPVISNSYRVQGTDQLSPCLVLSGWVGVTYTRLINDGEGEICNYALTIAFGAVASCLTQISFCK